MLLLCRHGRNVPALRRTLLLGSGPRPGAAFAAVIADVVVDDGSILDHSPIHIGVVDDRCVHVQHGRVVAEAAALPPAAAEAYSEVAEAIVDAAVETNLISPIALMEEESSVLPSPPGWSPKETGFGRHHPRARHPVVAVIRVIGPVAGSP